MDVIIITTNIYNILIDFNNKSIHKNKIDLLCHCRQG